MLSIERQFVRTERPLYGHLVELLENAIAKGELPSGTRVPPERTLAQRLKISRTTVVSAYRELESRGLFRGYVGRGTFVCAAPEPRGRRSPGAARFRRRRCVERLHPSRHVRNSSDSRLLSLAAGSRPSTGFRPTRSCKRSRIAYGSTARVGAWSDRGSAVAAFRHRRTLRRPRESVSFWPVRSRGSIFSPAASWIRATR